MKENHEQIMTSKKEDKGRQRWSRKIEQQQGDGEREKKHKDKEGREKGEARMDIV